MAQLPLIRQDQAANAHIDGATPSYLPTSINQPNQNIPHRSELSQDRRQNRHLCPKKDNSDVFPGGFAFCLGITLIDVAYFGFWRMSGSCAIYVPKNDIFLAIFYALAICHFAWPRKTGPTKSPEKELFPEFPKGNLRLGGVRFPGRTQAENWHCAGFPQFVFSTSIAAFLGHRWRNSHSFAKIRLGMPT